MGLLCNRRAIFCARVVGIWFVPAFLLWGGVSDRGFGSNCAESWRGGAGAAGTGPAGRVMASLCIRDSYNIGANNLRSGNGVGFEGCVFVSARYRNENSGRLL